MSINLYRHLQNEILRNWQLFNGLRGVYDNLLLLSLHGEAIFGQHYLKWSEFIKTISEEDRKQIVAFIKENNLEMPMRKEVVFLNK